MFLECVVEASPRPLTSWIRSDGHILLESKKYHLIEEVDSYRIRMRLRIHDLRKSDYGHYKCHAKNTFGEKEGFIRLHDIPHPTTLARPTPATEAAVHITKQSGRDDLLRLRAQADLSVPATKSFLDENPPDSAEPGVGVPSNEKSQSGNHMIDRVHYEPPGRNRASSTNSYTDVSPSSSQMALCCAALLLASRLL